MTSRSILMMGASALILSGAAFTTALADDYDTTRVRYDSQAQQTRDLNNESLERAQAQDDSDAQPDDDDSDGPAVIPTDDRDPQDDQDDDSPNSSNDEIS